ncbi:MAG: M28 family peptidase [Blastomonas sp.]
MIRPFLTALAATAALSSPALATHDPAALREQALTDDVAWQIVEDLTTRIGPRQAGTEREAEARAWAAARLKAMGFANVRIEPFAMPTWVRGEEHAEIVAPYAQKMIVTALGNSASTGDAGLEGEIVYFPTFADLVAAAPASLSGKIAFVDHAMHRTQDGSSYGAFGTARFVGPDLAAKKGAAAIVIRSIGTDNNRMPHTGNTGFSEGVTPIPAGALSVPDAENLARMVKLGKPVRMKLTLTPRNLGEQQSGNVIADLPGSDPDAGIILIACHLDSWDLGTGAIDDASGCGIITAAANLVKQHGQPRRTIRLLWAGAEEVGIWGGKAYAAAHGSDNHVLAMESDFGADRVWRVDFKLPEAAKPVSDAIVKALAPLGIGRGMPPAGGGADVGATIAAQNLAVVDLQQDGTHYFDTHHTANDTLDRIDPVMLRQNVAAWAATLAILANSEMDIGPVTP